MVETPIPFTNILSELSSQGKLALATICSYIQVTGREYFDTVNFDDVFKGWHLSNATIAVDELIEKGLITRDVKDNISIKKIYITDISKVVWEDFEEGVNVDKNDLNTEDEQ